MAIRSHIALRGNFQVCILDQARCFIRASRLLRRLISNVDFNDMRSALEKFSPEFHFIKATHHFENGLAESMISLLHTGLQRAIGTSTYPFDHMKLIIEECCSVLNSRRLSYVASTASQASQGLEAELAITPNLLCQGRNTIILPTEFQIDSNVEEINFGPAPSQAHWA